jgi:hypothetical protein
MRTAAFFTRAGEKANFVLRPKLPVNFPDERLEYYAWVFNQRGFSNLKMTFEQFLTVVATVHPSGPYPHRIRRQLLHVGVRPSPVLPAVKDAGYFRGAERRHRFVLDWQTVN